MASFICLSASAAAALCKAYSLQGRRLDSPIYSDLTTWLSSARQTDLAKVAAADFGGLRGVMALEDIAPGEEILTIPAQFALDLGTGFVDPLPAAEKLCVERIADEYTLERPAYFAVLPPLGSSDLTTPEFFPEDALAELEQWPPLVAEARRRRAVVEASAYSAGGGDQAATLLWAQWVVLSRVLTVMGPDGNGHKLLIPFIDLFNHDRASPHRLSGRTDGLLRVVAGAPVAAGQQVCIAYGDESTSNAELLGQYAAAAFRPALRRLHPLPAGQPRGSAHSPAPSPARYGFVDASEAMLAADEQLLRRQPEAVAALGASSIAEDEALLQGDGLTPHSRLAVALRLQLKRARDAAGLTP